MAVTDVNDPMAYLEEAKNRKNENTGDFTSRPFFFSIADGQKALIRPLLNLREYVRVHKHEYYDNTSKKWLFRSQCAKDLGQECQTCLDVEALPEETKEEKKIKRQARASERFVLPAYLHAVVEVKSNKKVTYTDMENVEHDVSGPRLLEMKPQTSPILDKLLTTYQASESHDISKRDFKIERAGVGIETVYTVEPKDPSSFDPTSHDIPAEYLDRDLVFSIYSDACPPRIVGIIEPAVSQSKATNGAIRNAPDF